MAKERKKVVLVIVEGPSDEVALSILKEYFSSDAVRFIVAHGDLTSRKGNAPSTIRGNLKKFIDENCFSLYKLKKKDVLQIIHIVDTDGVFINPEKIKEKSGISEVYYYTDRIETNNVENIISRNESKKNNINILISTGVIDKTIPYKIYYMSCNLEHVLFGKLENFTDAQKKKMSEDFDDKFHNNLQDFVEFIKNPDFAVSGDFKETWDFIQKDLNSLNRHTNLNLIFGE